MLKYCDKCGSILDDYGNKSETKCRFCSNELKRVPEKYLESPEFDFMLGDGMEEELLQELVFSSLNFEQTIYNEREREIEQRSNDWQNIKSIQQQKSNTPKCPTCQSTNIRKIGGVERGVSIWAFGLLSKKINKTFKCGSCGYTW